MTTFSFSRSVLICVCVNSNVIAWMTTFFSSENLTYAKSTQRILPSSKLSYPSCTVPAVILWSYCPFGSFKADLSGLNCQADLSPLICPTILSRLFSSGCPIVFSQLRASPDQAVQGDLSDWPVQTVMSRLSCLYFPYVLFWLPCYGCSVLVVLSQLSCPDMFQHSCPTRCPLLAVLF